MTRSTRRYDAHHGTMFVRTSLEEKGPVHQEPGFGEII